MAAKRTLTAKSAANNMAAFVAKWTNELRAGMTILLTQ